LTDPKSLLLAIALRARQASGHLEIGESFF
jgi:hypothetical protein